MADEVKDRSVAKADKRYDKAAYEMSGAAMLAEQPAEPKEKKVSSRETQQWGVLRSHLESRLVGLREWRSSWFYENWNTLAQYIEPRRSTFLTQSTGGWPSPNNMTRGRQINSAIVDPTATYAVRVCSSGLMSGLASPSRPWFKIVPTIKNIEIDAAGREWLDDVEDRIYTILAGSNFYNSFAQECEDLVVFGTAPVIIYEDEKDLIRCYNPCVGEYFLSSGATLRVDGLYRTFVMTNAQIVDFFKVENCPPDVQEMWRMKGSSLNTERIVAHSIEPNFGVGDTDAGKVPGKFTWREVYWIYGSGSPKPLSMRGFMDQPFTAARWSTQSNDAYGRSVGMDVLPDVIQLQIETLRKAEAIEKQVRPPLMADMQLKNQPSSILPGHVTYVQGLSAGTGMRPIYEVNPDINGISKDLMEIQQRVQRGFFTDLFLMLEQAGPKMTAFEVSARLVEKMNVLGPVIENIITDSLKPRLKRIFSIMQRKNLLPPMPDSMKAIPIDIQFTSLLAVAQKGAATGGMERLIGLVGNMVAVYPEVKDVVDPDAFLREFNDLLANPNKILRSEDAVAKLRAQAAAAAQKAQQQNDIAHGVSVAATGAQAAQTLANTKVGSGQDALNALFTSGTGSRS